MSDAIGQQALRLKRLLLILIDFLECVGRSGISEWCPEEDSKFTHKGLIVLRNKQTRNIDTNNNTNK